MEFTKLYQELQNSTEMIRALLSGVTADEARIKPGERSWSILEVICHLYDEEREDFREHLDWILNRQQEEWHQIDPQGWVIERKYNEQDFNEMQENFFAERTRSLEWLQGLSGENWETSHISQFGTMKAGDLLASWVAHDNLHIRQLVELRRLKIANVTKPYNLEYAGEW
jgi:uncharacterized damage-inducible protein DinB